MVEKHPAFKELKFTLTRIFNNPSAIAGFALLAFFTAVAVCAPYIAPPKYESRPYMVPHKGFKRTPKPPDREHLFGTTKGQYDVFYGVVWGTRTAFRIGLIVVVFSVVIGVALGAVAGYFGGATDELIMRFVDVVLALPFLVLVMAFIVALGRGLDNVILAIAIVNWRHYVRVMRASVLTLRDLEYIQAAKTMGVSHAKIIARHIVPNGIYPIVVIASMEMGSVVITASFLSFLGLGAPIGYADWGQMTAMARDFIIGPPENPLMHWHTIIFPGGAMILFVLAWNLIGDALRDAFDPKVRRR